MLHDEGLHTPGREMLADNGYDAANRLFTSGLWAGLKREIGGRLATATTLLSLCRP